MSAEPSATGLSPGTSLTGQRLPIGQTLKTSYLDTFHRRLRRGVASPTNDAAGLLNGRKYHGRSTPLRGKGTPPPDQKEEHFVSAKHMVPGKSFGTSYSNFLACPEDPTADIPVQRSHLKLTDLSHRSQLAGSAVAITSEAAPFKPARRPHTATVKTGRVLLNQDAIAEEPAGPEYTYFSTLRTEALACRPGTAPEGGVRRQATVARKNYEACRQGHADVIQYRHSGGICPADYKMSSERTAAPQVASFVQSAAREAFFESRRSYAMNKTRSWMSQSIVVS